MKQVKAFILTGCPYCRNAERAYRALTEKHPEYQDIPVEWIREDEQPEVADRYDYYYTPTMYVGEEKRYEAAPGQSYEEILEHVEEVLKAALE